MYNETVFNKKDYRAYKNFYALFQTSVKEFPDNIAVETDQEKITYQTLNQAVNNLVYHLAVVLRYDVKDSQYKDPLIAIYMERGYSFIVAMLACMKIGLPYLPLDTELPQELVCSMLEDSQAQWCLTIESSISSLILPKKCQIVVYQNVRSLQSQDFKINSELMYVMYTSGSTDRPKGVMVDHVGMTDCLAAHDDIIRGGINPALDKILHFSSTSFDASAIEIMMALGTGATLVIIPSDIRTLPEALTKFCQTHQVSIAILTPDKLKHLSQKEFKTLRALFIVGAAFPKELSDLWLEDGRQVVNGYGLTETKICATLENCHKDKLLTIGKPIKGFEIRLRKLTKEENFDPLTSQLLLEENQKISWLKKGEVGKENEGEIFIFGPGLAKGYWRREDLTVERFIFLDGNRAYRTGDLAYWTKEEDLVFTRRLGRQVKLRGQRIELGIIEQYIQNYFKNKIQHVCIIAKKNELAELQLLAYIVPTIEWLDQLDDLTENSLFLQSPYMSIELEKLYEHLKTVLPRFAVPSLNHLFMLKELPFKQALGSKSGIDYQAVEKIEPLFAESKVIAGRDELEKKLIKIWSTLLLIPEKQISIEHDFFALGGDSLTYGRMIEQVNKLLEKPLTLSKISLYFKQSSTVSTLRALIHNQEQYSWTHLNLPQQMGSDPLYLIHSLTGDPKEDYLALLENLSPKRCVIGFKIREPLGIYPSLSLIALDYVEQLLSDVQLKNMHPKNAFYCIAAWSTGGCIAFEMGRILSQKGLNYRIVMIDTLYPGNLRQQSVKALALVLDEITPILIKVLNSSAQPFKLSETDAFKSKGIEHYQHVTVVHKYFEQLLRRLFLAEPRKIDLLRNRLQQIKRLYLAELNYSLTQAIPKYLHIMSADTMKKSNELLGWFCPPQDKTVLRMDHFKLIQSTELANLLERYATPVVRWGTIERPINIDSGEKEFEKLYYSQQETRLINQLICGVSHVGKTSLLTTLIHQRHEKIGYQVIAIFHSENLPTQFQQFVKEKLNLDIEFEVSLENLIALAYKKLAKQGICLMVFDGVTDQIDIELYISSMRPKNIHVLITSETKKWDFDRFQTFKLSVDEKSPEECQSYLMKNIPQINIEDSNEIARILNYYPLAIKQAVNYFNKNSHTLTLKDFIKQLPTLNQTEEAVMKNGNNERLVPYNFFSPSGNLKKKLQNEVLEEDETLNLHM